MASSRVTWVLAAGLLVTCASSAVWATPTTPVVATDAGPVRGTTMGPMQAFLGIPYAAAPTGDLR